MVIRSTPASRLGNLAEAALAAGLALILASCASRRGPERLGEHRAREREEAGEAGHRPMPPIDDWFMRQRLSGGPIPDRERENAWDDWQRSRRSAPAGSAAAAPDAPGVWVQAGPINIGGRLTALAVDPNNASHIWAGAAGGGVWDSADGGVSWTPRFDSILTQSIGSVATHPSSSSVVFVGTGEDNGAGYSYDGSGVYKTVDGGATWQNIGLPETKRIGRIAIDPSNPDRIFVAAGGDIYSAGTFRGVYRTLDGGLNWQQVLFVNPTTGASDVIIDPSNPSRIYAATWDRHCDFDLWVPNGVGSGIWRSTDGGNNWTRLTGGLPAITAQTGRIGIALARSSPSTLYAEWIEGAGTFRGVYKTANSGASWVRVDVTPGPQNNIFGGYSYYFGQIRVDPANANKVYLLDVYWADSSNGGVNWTAHTGQPNHPDHHDLVFAGGKLLLANDAGFYSSANGGTSWTHATTMAVSQFYDLGIDPINPLHRFGGLQDNGSVRTLTGATNNWVGVVGGDGFQCEVDPVNNNFVYCESQNGGIARSTNGGTSFSGFTSGFSGRKNWNTPITHDPLLSQRVYTASHQVFRSTGGGAWQSISPDLTDGPIAHPPPGPGGPDPQFDRSHLASVVEGTITTVAVSRINNNIVWVGTDDGNVWVTTTGGSPWTRVDVPGRSEWVTRVEADPFDPDAAFVTFSGYRNGSYLPHVFRTDDLGNTWMDISGNLPVVPVNDVVADSANLGRVFVGTDLGSWVSDDWGATWTIMSGGMPTTIVLDFDLISSTRTLFAGTHGRSMWTFALDQLPPPDRDGDGTVNVLDCAPDDAGAFAVASEVTGLRLAADTLTLDWNTLAPQAGPGTTYNVVRGDLGELPVGTGMSESCVASGSTLPTATDASVPAAGAGFWYLVRGRNGCGAGTYGTTSSGIPRLTSACP